MTDQQDLRDAKAELDAAYKAYQEADQALPRANTRFKKAQLRWTEVSTAFLEEQLVNANDR